MTEKSIIIELQLLSLKDNTNISELLRKAYLVASKLNLNEFKTWINSELNGYDQSELPEYRIFPSVLKQSNIFSGAIPVVINNLEYMKAISTIRMVHPISKIISLIESSDNDFVQWQFGPKTQQFFIEGSDDPSNCTPVYGVFSISNLVGIVEKVKNSILNWALELEKEGIIGEGIIFSNIEKEKAMTNQNINISHFQGVIGDINNSELKQKLKMSVKINDFQTLKEELLKNNIEDRDIAELKKAIAADPTPKKEEGFGCNVSQWIGYMIQKASEGSWAISLGAAGNLLATAISAYYGIL